MVKWQLIEEYPTHEVSDDGYIRNIRTGRISRGGFTRGYFRVILSDGVGRRGFLVHRLVAKAFIPAIPGCEQINHINAVKTDNRVNNLEWVTPQQNIRHAMAMGLMRPKRGSRDARTVLTESAARRISKSEGKVTQAELARKYGVSASTIRAIWRGKIWRHVTHRSVVASSFLMGTTTALGAETTKQGDHQ